MRGKEHPPEVKAAVMAALLTGQSVSEVATAYSLDVSVVSRWRKRLSSTTLQEVASKRADDLESLLMDYVRTNLETLKAQSEIVRERAYVEKQSASEIAVLHGVLADKTFRVLSSYQPEPEPESGNDLVN